MAGTQVRLVSVIGPMSTGLYHIECAAVSSEGQAPGSGKYLIFSGGFHMARHPF